MTFILTFYFKMYLPLQNIENVLIMPFFHMEFNFEPTVVGPHTHIRCLS